jgi:hypothetical protein
MAGRSGDENEIPKVPLSPFLMPLLLHSHPENLNSLYHSLIRRYFVENNPTGLQGSLPAHQTLLFFEFICCPPPAVHTILESQLRRHRQL